MKAPYDAFSASFANSREKQWPDLHELMNLPELANIHTCLIGDVGCGSGRLLEYFLQKPDPVNYFGFDMSDGMLAQARIRYPEYTFESHVMGDLFT